MSAQRTDLRREVLLTESELRSVEGAFAGALIAPGDARYDAARRVWNEMVDRRPALIVRCAGERDVVAALRLAREHGLPVAVRGGGHNVAGNAVCDGGVVIDLSSQKGISVDAEARTARAQPGVLLGELDQATQAFGLATPTGNVSMTGVAGLTLGGGLGWIARKHGPACDNLIAADVVTVDGAQVRASADEHPDLLWGLFARFATSDDPWRTSSRRRRTRSCRAPQMPRTRAVSRTTGNRTTSASSATTSSAR
jgi:FAD/FMN-containing dehydrogenase